jgi:hypothetical protein
MREVAVGVSDDDPESGEQVRRKQTEDDKAKAGALQVLQSAGVVRRSTPQCW